ncbi:hypothetical protein Tco_1568228 [Tanacetum coccineum]
MVNILPSSNDSSGTIWNFHLNILLIVNLDFKRTFKCNVSTPITTTEKGVSAPKSKEVEPSCVSHIKTPRQPIKDQATPKVNRKNWNAMMERELGEGYSFTKKKCFVCGSLSHLIKDCDYYEKKMAREAEFKKQRVFNTGNGVAKPVWTNTDMINHANQFVPRPVQLNAGRPNINSVRPNINTGRTNINSVRPNINTGRTNINFVRPNINTGRVNVNSVKSNVNTGRTNVNPVRPRVNTGSSNVNTVRSRQPVPIKTSNNFSPKRPQGNWGTAVKTSAGKGNNAWGGGAAGYGGAQNRVGNANPGQARQIKQDVADANSDLALNVDNVFQADDYDAFDSDVDEALMAQTMFMANLSSADPVYDEASLSYDSGILSKVHDHDHYQDAVCEHHEEHEMHDDVQPNYVVDSHANYTSDSNMIPYEQYVKDNAMPVVQSNVSSIPNDAYMMIFNDMHEPHAQPVSVTTRNTVVNNSLTAELATYKE